MSLPSLTLETTWFPIVLTWLETYFPTETIIYVVVRTNWACINLLMRRFDIEEMFRDFKSGGYNLEDTNVSGERLIVLILLIALAYTSATILGQQIKR